jgi:outer membrane lipoprotein
MKVQPIIKLLPLVPLLAALAGCATCPISTSLREKSRPVTLTQVLTSPEATRGTTVIWGGRIIQTVNDTNGAGVFVLALPLSHYEKPEPDANSEGRFIARSGQFLDPEIFRQGRLVTVAGTIAGVETRRIQKAQYPYPVLDVQQIYVWPRVRTHYWDWGWYYPDWGWGYDPGWSPGWGWYHPGWYWGWDDPDDWD